MNSSREPGPNPGSRDLLSLASAPIAELVADLYSPATIADEGGNVPPRANQVADFITAEAVRLIRIGTRKQLTDAAVLVSHSLLTRAAEQLRDRRPEAYRVVSGASIALATAAAPSSGAGELTVLRSWNGMARKAVALVSRAEGQAIPRAELREQLGVDESYLSHLLTDLEAASLVVRIRHGRSVTVHLGPTGRGKHVQELLPADPLGDGRSDPKLEKNRTIAYELFQCLFDGGAIADRVRSHQIKGWQELETRFFEARDIAAMTAPRVDDAVAEGNRVVCKVVMMGGGERLTHHQQVWTVRIEDDKPVEVDAWDSRPEPLLESRFTALLANAYHSGVRQYGRPKNEWTPGEVRTFSGDDWIVRSQAVDKVDNGRVVDKVGGPTAPTRISPLPAILKSGDPQA